MTTRSKNPSKNPKTEARRGQKDRHLGVMMEELGDDVRLLAEQYGGMRNTLDEQTAILQRLGEILAAHGVMLSQHGEMLRSLTVRVDVIAEDVTFVKNAVKTKVDSDEFAALERRVAALEREGKH